MGRYDFDFGYNVVPPTDAPTYVAPSPEPEQGVACMGRVVCERCKKLHGYCSEVNEQLTGVTNDPLYTTPGVPYGQWESSDMIPRTNTGTNTGSGSNQQGGGRRKGSGFRYLSADMLSASHQLAVIADARVEKDTFRQGSDAVVVKLKFKGEFLLWTLRPGNPALETLGDAMGDDEANWKDHEIELYLEEDNFNGKKWIRADIAPKGSATKKGR